MLIPVPYVDRTLSSPVSFLTNFMTPFTRSRFCSGKEEGENQVAYRYLSYPFSAPIHARGNRPYHRFD